MDAQHADELRSLEAQLATAQAADSLDETKIQDLQRQINTLSGVSEAGDPAQRAAAAAAGRPAVQPTAATREAPKAEDQPAKVAG